MNIIWTDKKRTLFGLPLSFTTYELEEERLFIRTGLLTRIEDEIRLYRIIDITLKQTLGQRIFGIGTIHCSSTDSSQKEFDILSIKNPREVREQLSQLVEAQREKKRVYNREIMSTDSTDDNNSDL